MKLTIFFSTLVFSAGWLGGWGDQVNAKDQRKETESEERSKFEQDERK